MKKTIYSAFFALSLLICSRVQGQANSILLKDGGGTLINSYNSITAAYAAIPGTLTQPYIIEIDASYTGGSEVYPITFIAKTGASPSNTITLRPALGVVSKTIQTTIAAGSSGVVVLDDADYIVIDGRAGGVGNTIALTFNNLSTASNGNTMVLINGACFNRVRYCTILNSTTGNAGRNVFLGASATNVTGNSDNDFRYCNIHNGRYQFNLGGTVANRNTRNTIFGCDFRNSTFAAIWSQAGSAKVKIDSCSFYCTTPTGDGLFSGILFDSQNDSAIILNNRLYDIQDLTTGTLRYIHVRSVAAGGTSTVEIRNNFFSMTTGNAALTNVGGVEITGTNPVVARIIHNSFRIGGSQTAAGTSGNVSSACVIITSSEAAASFTVANNLMLNERTGGTGVQHVAMSVSNAAPSFSIFNNTYNSTSGDLVRWLTTAYNNIAAYQAVVPGGEPGANNTAIPYVSNTNLHLTCNAWSSVPLSAPSISAILKDIDGESRPAITHRGADEANVAISVINSGCNGGNNGSATVNPGVGTFTYNWAPSGGTSATATGLGTGIYSVTLDNGAGCAKTQTVSIQQLPNFTTSIVKSDVGCNGMSNGSATVLVTGVTGSFSYSWIPSAITASAVTGLAAGVYTSVVTNTDLCTSVKTFTINQTPGFTLAITGNTNVCAGNSTTLMANASGGTGAITYSWVNGPATGTNVVNPIIATTYTVNITDVNNCTGTSTVHVATYSLPAVVVNSGSVCVGSTFTMSPSGALTYMYSSGDNTVSPTSDANYTVTGTDANGCLNTAVSSVTVNSLPVITVNSGSVCLGSTFTMNPLGAVSYVYSNGSNTVSPTVNSIYTVTGTDANGCKNTAVSSVATASLPLITVNSGSVCQGSVFTMNPGGGVSYVYSTGNSTVAPVANETFTVTGTGTNGCENIALSSVTVVALPVLTFTTSNYTLCLNGSSVNLSGSPAGGVYSGVNVSGNKFTPSTVGSFTPSYSYTNSSTGCSNLITTNIYVVNCTGLQDVNNSGKTMIYPNPNNGKLYLQFSDENERKIRVIDLSGRLVSEMETVALKETLDITRLNNGVYYIIIENKGSVEMFKTIKQ